VILQLPTATRASLTICRRRSRWTAHHERSYQYDRFVPALFETGGYSPAISSQVRPFDFNRSTGFAKSVPTTEVLASCCSYYPSERGDETHNEALVARGTREDNMLHHIRRLVASVSMLSLALVCVSARAADANALWSSPVAVDAHGSLSSVSCPDTRFCAAVDSQGYVVTYNGTSWGTPSAVGGGSTIFESISCPSETFCAATDYYGNAYTYNGKSWSPPTEIDGEPGDQTVADDLLSVSCSSSNFCVAVSAGNQTFTYNGT
jgi:hypothetical protein